MKAYRIDKEGLFAVLAAWSGFFKRRVRLIACGGTAMTLLGIKDSTKDIDFIVPDEGEYKYLLARLAELGYSPVTRYGWSKDGGFVFDLFPGNRVYETELLSSPLEAGGNMPLKEFDRIYVGVLNHYDILISKLFRSSSVDREDCLGLVRAVRGELDLAKLRERFKETASYDVSEARVLPHLASFMRLLEKEGLS